MTRKASPIPVVYGREGKVAKCGYSSRVCAAVKILQLIDVLQNSHIFRYIFSKLHVSE